MTLKELKLFFSEQLSEVYPTTEVDSFFSIIIEEKLKLQRIDTVLNPDFLIKENTLAEFKNILKRLLQQEPLQYILGKTEFYGLPFLVDSNTLIPRPETEELVDWILTEIKNIRIENLNKKLTILDIGTGTGCIPISLAKKAQNIEISAIDISTKALKIAKQNADLNSVEIAFFELDILKTKDLNTISKENKQETSNTLNKQFTSLKEALKDIHFDIIVSNPPYVRELEKIEIKNNVLQNEPHLALFVEDQNPLIFYKKIADLAKIHLTEKGLLFFEINQYLGKETLAMLKEKGFTSALKKDIFGNDRMTKSIL